MMKRLQGVAVGVLVGVLVTGGVAYAVTAPPGDPDPTDRYYACVSAAHRVKAATVRLNVAPTQCPATTDSVESWDATSTFGEQLYSSATFAFVTDGCPAGAYRLDVVASRGAPPAWDYGWQTDSEACRSVTVRPDGSVSLEGGMQEPLSAVPDYAYTSVHNTEFLGPRWVHIGGWSYSLRCDWGVGGDVVPDDTAMSVNCSLDIPSGYQEPADEVMRRLVAVAPLVRSAPVILKREST